MWWVWEDVLHRTPTPHPHTLTYVFLLGKWEERKKQSLAFSLVSALPAVACLRWVYFLCSRCLLCILSVS